jgi:archaeal flagellin FlaB
MSIKRVINREEGITGLETAIILIAFVIVASVLSYVVISSGLFSSQKARAAVNAGLDQTGATIELKGNVTATLSVAEGGGPDTLSEVSFTVGMVPGGGSIDITDNPPLTGGHATPTSTASLNRLIVGFSNNDIQIPSLFWEKQVINFNNEDNMLDPGELAVITVYLGPAMYIDAYPDFTGVTSGSTFSLGVIPPEGSVLQVERTVPSGLKVKAGANSTLVNLY